MSLTRGSESGFGAPRGLERPLLAQSRICRRAVCHQFGFCREILFISLFAELRSKNLSAFARKPRGTAARSVTERAETIRYDLCSAETVKSPNGNYFTSSSYRERSGSGSLRGFVVRQTHGDFIKAVQGLR